MPAERRRRRGLVALVALLLPFGWLAGCGRGPQPGEVNLWTIQLTPKFDPVIRPMLADWERRHPGRRVVWTDLPFGSVERKLLAAVYAGRSPDVVNLNPVFAANLASKGGLLALENRLGEATGDYLPQVLEAGRQDGRLYAVPWYLTSRITLANRELLRQAGLERPPLHWQEVPRYAETVHRRTGHYALFVTAAPDGSAELLESMVQMGVTLTDGRHRARFRSPAGERAFAFWTDLYRRGLLPREVVSQGFQRAIELYQSGELAQVASGAEFLGTIATNAPRVAAATAPYPPLTGSDGVANVAAMNLAVTRQSRHPAEAVDLALFLTNAQNQLRFARAARVLPSSRTALATLAQELGDQAGGDLVQRARWLSARTLLRARVLVPADPGIRRLQSILYRRLQQAMLGEMSSSDALRAAERDWNAYAAARWP